MTIIPASDIWNILFTVTNRIQDEKGNSDNRIIYGYVFGLAGYAGGPFKEGMTEWSFGAGYGRNFHIGGKNPNVSEDIQFVPFPLMALEGIGVLLPRQASGYVTQ